MKYKNKNNGDFRYVFGYFKIGYLRRLIIIFLLDCNFILSLFQKFELETQLKDLKQNNNN